MAGRIMNSQLQIVLLIEYKLVLKMRHNHSSKDIAISRSKNHSQSKYLNHSHFHTYQTIGTFNSSINKLTPNIAPKIYQIQRTLQTTRSQRQLDPYRLKMTSNLQRNPSQTKPIQLSKHLNRSNRQNHPQTTIEPKVYKNDCVLQNRPILNNKQLNYAQNCKNDEHKTSKKEEPRKHKILNKQRQSSVLTDLKVGKILGKGKFGYVIRAQHVPTNSLLAVKQISLENLSQKLIQRLTWEIKIQSYLKNEHCLELYRFQRQGNNLYLLMQLGDCSLYDKLREKQYFTEVQTCYYVSQTIKALKYMHNQGVIHRDIKPQNIVLCNNVVKLADFGWSIYNGKKQSEYPSKRTTFCGTLDYMSPEVVLGNQYDEMVDVWSVGVLCYQLCTGHAPFQSNHSRQQKYRKIVDVDLKYPKYLSEGIKDFISRLLNRCPQKRMSLQQAEQHSWMRKYYTY